jgi:nitrogen fixation NifU-like protein
VMNPLVGLDLVKTELISGIMVEKGKVTIAVDLPETNQFANVIRQEIVEKVEPLWDVKEVVVRYTK